VKQEGFFIATSEDGQPQMKHVQLCTLQLVQGSAAGFNQLELKEGFRSLQLREFITHHFDAFHSTGVFWNHKRVGCISEREKSRLYGGPQRMRRDYNHSLIADISIRDRPKLHFSFSAETKLAPKLIFWLGRKRKRN